MSGPVEDHWQPALLVPTPIGEANAVRPNKLRGYGPCSVGAHGVTFVVVDKTYPVKNYVQRSLWQAPMSVAKPIRIAQACWANHRVIFLTVSPKKIL